MKQAVIIFVRKPVLGKVKTRLAASVGNEKALEIYLGLLAHTRAVALQTPAQKAIFYADELIMDDLWNGNGFAKYIQSNKDLGGKMCDAFNQLFEEGHQQVLIIGSDCFELTSNIIEAAFTALENNDVVIGPASDGGYYLLGMKKLHSYLFTKKEWSTSTVYSDTLKDFTAHQLSFKVLPVLTDVDTEEDWLLTNKF